MFVVSNAVEIGRATARHEYIDLPHIEVRACSN